MDDLRTMMEHEMWHRCPLQPDFTLYDVKEFRAGLRRDSPVYSNTDNITPTKTSHLSKICETGNPFANTSDENSADNASTSSNSI